MKCPICVSEMVAGTVIIGNINGSAFYPGSTEGSKSITKLKLFFSGSSINLTNVDQAWQCSNCKKIIVIYCND